MGHYRTTAEKVCTPCGDDREYAAPGSPSCTKCDVVRYSFFLFLFFTLTFFLFLFLFRFVLKNKMEPKFSYASLPSLCQEWLCSAS